MNNDIARFNTFCENVKRWSAERGIYAHSTALAQGLKALSEAGELADAAIKNDMDALKDAIGDVAVCTVNVMHMDRAVFDVAYVFDDSPTTVSLQRSVAYTGYSVGHMCHSLADGHAAAATSDTVDMVLLALRETARIAGLSFADCCEAAWKEIKDRKGRMVPGGAFVKEDV